MSSYMSSGIQGAGTGAAAGAAFGPYGVAIGAGVGLLAGVFSAYEQEQDAEKRKQILEQAAAQYNMSMSDMRQKLNEWYENNESIGTKEDVQNYKNAIANYDPNEFVYDFEDFDNNYDVNNYYAPNRSAIIQKTTDSLQSTAAGSGIGRGTGAANKIATGVANKNEELYKDALTAMNQDRQFAYQLWNSNIQNQQQRLNQLKSATDSQINLYGSLANDFQTWNQNKLQQELDLDNQEASNNLNLQLAKASI